MRTFVSIDIDGLEDAVEAAQDPFRDLAGVRTTRPDQAHLTLKFLGDVTEDRLGTVKTAIEDAVERADTDPFSLPVGGYGVFPSTDYISVVWLGCRDGSEQVERIQQAIEDELTLEGFDPEEHAFTPHITIARVDDARSKEEVQDILQEQDPDIGTMTVEEVRLKESTTTPDGPEYSTLESFPL